MYHFTLNGVQFSCDSMSELLAVAEQTHVASNGEELTTRKPWGSRRASAKKKRATLKRKSVRSAETRKATPKKKTKANTAAKKSWAAARKRSKTEGISVKEARAKIAAKQGREPKRVTGIFEAAHQTVKTFGSLGQCPRHAQGAHMLAA